MRIVKSLMVAILSNFIFMSVSFSAVLTFDDISGASYAQIPDGYGGLDWSTGINGLNYINPIAYGYSNSGFINGTVSGDYVAFNNSNEINHSVSITGSDFDFIGAYLTAAASDGLNVHLQGYDDTILKYDSTVVVNPYSFMGYTFNFFDIDELVLSSYGGTYIPGFDGGGTYFVMDDFRYKFVETTVVPEPSTLLLLGGGLAGLAFYARRRRKE